MSTTNINTNSKKYKHLTEKERYKIEVLLKAKKKASEIAILLGKSVRTIQREIKRGTIALLNTDLTYRNEYLADVGQRRYNEAASNKGRNYKIGYDHALVEYIEDKIINEKYSPDAIIGEIQAKGMKFQVTICTKTLYNYINANFFLNVTNKDLPLTGKRKKRKHRKIRISLKAPVSKNIDYRPLEVQNREIEGHWEMDCVVGGLGKGKAALLVITERKSRYSYIFKIKSKTQEQVIKQLDKLERRFGLKNFKESFKSITVDNGAEFLDYEGIEQSNLNGKHQRTELYYAHPYCSWERGSNENFNKMIRRFIPKGTNIDEVTDSTIKRVEQWINNYPRKILNYKSSSEVISISN